MSKLVFPFKNLKKPEKRIFWGERQYNSLVERCEKINWTKDFFWLMEALFFLNIHGWQLTNITHNVIRTYNKCGEIIADGNLHNLYMARGSWKKFLS